jgi:hypothetical protein
VKTAPRAGKFTPIAVMTAEHIRDHNEIRGGAAMTLHGEEQRRLSEIERQLAEENPRLAQRLAELRPMRIPTVVLAILGALCSMVSGMFLLVAAAVAQVPFLMALGTVLTSVVPTAILWRTWLYRLR